VNSWVSCLEALLTQLSFRIGKQSGLILPMAACLMMVYTGVQSLETTHRLFSTHTCMKSKRRKHHDMQTLTILAFKLPPREDG
jgi:hypothetical protein